MKIKNVCSRPYIIIKVATECYGNTRELVPKYTWGRSEGKIHENDDTEVEV